MKQIEWEENSSDLGYGQLLGILWRRRFWIGGVFLGVLAVAIPLALMKQPLYMSQMQLLIESNYQTKDSTRGNDNNQYLEEEFADSSIEIDYPTQLKLMRSSYLLKKVVKKLGVEGSDAEIAEIVEQLKSSLSVYQVIDESEDNKGTETKIIEVAYVSQDYNDSKKILEAIEQVYIEYNVEQQEKRLRDGLAFIAKQIPAAQQEVAAIEAKLTQLRSENNLVSPQGESESIKAVLNNIQQERATLKAEQKQTQGNYRQLQQELGLSAENSVAMTRLNQSSQYQSLLNKLQQIEIELADKQARFTDDNPVVKDLLAQKNTQTTLLLQEVKKILGAVPPNFAVQLQSLLRQGELVNSKTNFIETITQSQADLKGLEERDRSLAQTESELREKLTQFPALIARYDSLTQEANLKKNALQRLLAAKQELEIALSRGAYNWQVIESPQLGVQIAPNTTKDILLSLVVASFLGGTTAFIKESLDEQLYNSRQIQEKIALPLLGSTPGLPLAKHDQFVVKLPFLSPKESSVQEIINWQPFRESLDLIYENLQRLGSGFAFKSLLLTSAVAGEGKSTLVLGLAFSIARHQKRVLVIDADLRCPSLHEKLGVENNSGLSDLLQGTTASLNIQQVTLAGENIDLVTCGSRITDPVKFLSSPKFKQSIDQLQANYDLILIDTPPVLGMVDAIKISGYCGGTMIVSRLNQVKATELIEATNLLCNSNSKVLGIVVNNSQDVTMRYQKQPQYLLSQPI
ncbi:capsular exopolysaccharide family [Stanieria cyanosphaera PCC 7437]|uniref:non-specific protein-tyrosine kinase n=1 Tax=Stanieria cyanosphaera (strain ATCC 29371 / PCC 7437) TaxID=111780 RepID=K9XPB0_STAC7|nr:polysaccharide biosynthesis tyrosine autokinase [Stanieria cyanosphaera]AFZ34368.1 capsular exopolysaccharide family [Stanieria cyanosphaera PCC 7437]